MAVKKTAEKEKVLGTEDIPQRGYELVMVISPEVADEQLEAKVDEVSRFITERGGVIASVEQWGKRKLAYPIKSFTEGNYVLSRFDSKPSLCKQLETSLQISEDVLRYLLIRSGD
ncbi:MAG: 30S ribosomal protein S6 [Dehalococcoidales bacterium]|nr:30S ribosomal protein S6 [Dehalococcoidales bacterium]